MSQDSNKKSAAEAALAFVEAGMVIGVGTGSTVNYFIDVLPRVKEKIDGAVASSDATAKKLQQQQIPLLDLNDTDDIPLYVDGADEATKELYLIKGGGGALTREKIVAAASREFVCIADQSKLVDVLGAFPLPVEVIPMATNYVRRQLATLGGCPIERDGLTTDNGNLILDVHDLNITDPKSVEESIDHIAGVVSNGIFARRPADILLLGTDEGVKEVKSLKD